MPKNKIFLKSLYFVLRIVKPGFSSVIFYTKDVSVLVCKVLYILTSHIHLHSYVCVNSREYCVKMMSRNDK